jgi:hypothetical protein
MPPLNARRLLPRGRVHRVTAGWAAPSREPIRGGLYADYPELWRSLGRLPGPFGCGQSHPDQLANSA